MYRRLLPVLLTTLTLAATPCFAQTTATGTTSNWVVAPTYPITLPLPLPIAQGMPVVTSLGMPGYDFTLLKFWNNSVTVYIDPQGPIAIPLVATAASTTSTSTSGLIPSMPIKPGFWVNFEVANNSTFPRNFEFVDKYYADLRIVVTMLNAKDEVVWQSYKTETDIPPKAKKVTLVLPARSKWQQRVFVPLTLANQAPLKSGSYTIQAEVIGTPGYVASAPFKVTTLTAGPIVSPLPLPLPLPVTTLK